jgi:hypothetical protein
MRLSIGALLGLCATAVLPASAATITINAGAGLSGHAPALAAFQRAANRWGSLLSDSVVVTIDGELATLDPGTIGRTSVRGFAANWGALARDLRADAADEPDDAVAASLPDTVAFYLPPNFTWSGQLGATKANLKALGYDMDSQFGAQDATITFNSGFTFDYDSSNGIAPGAMDFETVAAHEIGHALGFVSIVDSIDLNFSQGGALPVYLLDLFRFGPDADPANVADFATMRRDLRPGVQTFFDDGAHEYLMSTGRLVGDGRQASHWKDDLYTGVMDPTPRPRADLRDQLGGPARAGRHRVGGQLGT